MTPEVAGSALFSFPAVFILPQGDLVTNYLSQPQAVDLDQS
jgi:hypothetical protein